MLARKWGASLGLPTTQVTDEISGYMLALAATWGLAYALRSGSHVRIDVLFPYLAPRLRAVVDVLAMILMALFAAIVSWKIWALVADSRLSERLYHVLSHWLAPLPGGLLHSNIAFCAVFGAISGSSAACAATVGAVALPSFRARNYNERLVIGSLAAGGTLDILIPPSISMIIYGVLAEESIGRLYLAGFIPGFLLAGIFMFIIALAAKIWPSVAPREAAPSWRQRFLGLLSLFPVIR